MSTICLQVISSKVPIIFSSVVFQRKSLKRQYNWRVRISPLWGHSYIPIHLVRKKSQFKCTFMDLMHGVALFRILRHLLTVTWNLKVDNLCSKNKSKMKDEPIIWVVSSGVRDNNLHLYSNRLSRNTLFKHKVPQDFINIAQWG